MTKDRIFYFLGTESQDEPWPCAMSEVLACLLLL